MVCSWPSLYKFTKLEEKCKMFLVKHEQQHEKTNSVAVRHEMTQISLGIRSLLSRVSCMHDNKRVFIATHSEHSHARIKRIGGGGGG